jgi:hypothetical protein
VRISRTLSVLLALVLLAVSGIAVLAQTARQLPSRRSTAAPPPAMPSLAPLLAPAARAAIPPFPPVPKDRRARRPRSAYGAYMNLVQNAGTCTQPANTDIFPLNCQLTIGAKNLPTAAATYQDYVQAPNGTIALATLGGTYTGNADPGTAVLTLSQQGIYTVGALNTTINAGHPAVTWDAVAYIAVGSQINFDTYSDSALSVPQQNVVANGSNAVYLSANGLTPTDAYVFAIENTSDNGYCVFTAPQQGSYPNGLCPVEKPTVTGVVSSSGTYTASWVPAIGTPAALQAGAYSVSLYDQTTHQRVGQRNFTVLSPTGGAAAAVVQFYDGTGVPFSTTGSETVPRVAYNGNGTAWADSNMTYVNVYNGATGLNNAHTYRVTIADPQGNVVKQFADQTPASGALTSSNDQWGLPNNTGLPLASSYTGNVYTTSIYDVTAKATVASQAWQVLGYSMLPTFPTGSNQLQAASGSGSVTDATITFLNDGNVRFGDGNSDSLQKIVVTTSGPFPALACTGGCAPILDTDHQSWTVALTGSAAAGFTLTLTAPANQGLKPGSQLVVPLKVTAGASPVCPSSTPCTLTSSIFPLHNNKGSGGQYVASQMQVTDNGSNHSGTIVAEIVGNTANATSLQLLPGYTPYTNTHLGTYMGVPYANLFAANAYAANQPFASAAGSNIYGFAITNTSSSGSATFSAVAITLPPGIDASKVTSAGAGYSFSGVPNTTFTVTNCGGLNGIPANSFCISNWNGNGTAISNGQLFYCFVDIPQSSVSFPYSPVGGIIYNGDAGFGHLINLTADGTRDVFAPKAQSGAQIAANSIAAYSLNASEMLSTVTPGTLGTNLTNNVTLQFENTPYSSDPFPDWVDGVLVEVPTPGAAQPVSSITTQFGAITPAGWQFLNGQSSFVYGGHTYYWFGLCTNQYDTSYTLPNSIGGTTRGGDAPKADQCAQSPNEQEALQPGQTFSVPMKIVTTGNTGAYTGYIFAHGGNGNGWSSGTPFTINVQTGTAASAGFSAVGTYNAGDTAPPLSAGSQPAIGGDSNATYGNSYVYTVTNTGNNTIGKIEITVPGTTNTGAPGADSGGVYPTLTPASFSGSVSYTGNNGSGGCQIIAANGDYASSSSQNANDGVIRLENCNLQPGDSVNVAFSMKMPYRVNVIYAFPTAVYAKATPAVKVASAETWVNDTTMTITNTAVLSVAVNSGVSCTGTGWTYNTSTNLLDFGAVAPSSSKTCTGAVQANVWTPLAAPYGWSLYASIDNNPATTGAAVTNEAQVAYSATGSQTQDANVLPGTATYTVLPTSPGSGGFLVAQTTGAGTTQSYRTPYIFMTNYRITVGTEAVAAQQHTITFTWISN